MRWELPGFFHRIIETRENTRVVELMHFCSMIVQSHKLIIRPCRDAGEELVMQRLRSLYIRTKTSAELYRQYL